MPRISRANRKPSPSRRRLRLKPSSGSQSWRASRRSPASAPRWLHNSARPASGTSAVAVAQALRPRRSARIGRKMPRNGSATISARIIDHSFFIPGDARYLPAGRPRGKTAPIIRIYRKIAME
ncbi:hypothetical protein D9M72_619980 [compost metagenome]